MRCVELYKAHFKKVLQASKFTEDHGAFIELLIRDSNYLGIPNPLFDKDDACDCGETKRQVLSIPSLTGSDGVEAEEAK